MFVLLGHQTTHCIIYRFSIDLNDANQAGHPIKVTGVQLRGDIFEAILLVAGKQQMDETKLKRQTFGVFNPNQRQFFEDELRYREKLQQLHAGLNNESQLTQFILN